MTRKLVIVTLFLAAAMAVGCTSAKVSLSKKLFTGYNGKSIAIIDVTSESGHGEPWTALVAGKIDVSNRKLMVAALERNLVHQGYFEVVDASRLKRIMDEKGIEPPELIDASLAVQLGRVVGLDGVVVLDAEGSISWLWPYSELNYRATAKLVDVQTGSLVWSAEGLHGAVGIVPFQMFETGFKHVYDRVAAEMVAEIGAKYQTGMKAAREALVSNAPKAKAE